MKIFFLLCAIYCSVFYNDDNFKINNGFIHFDQDTSVLGRLQGRWVSVDDKMYTLHFKDRVELEFYNGKAVDTSKIFISDFCAESTLDLNPKRRNGSILVKAKINGVSTSCFKIEELNRFLLVLNYRGRQLVFKRKF